MVQVLKIESGAENSSEIRKVLAYNNLRMVLSQAPVVVHMLNDNIILHIELHAGVSSRLFENIQQS